MVNEHQLVKDCLKGKPAAQKALYQQYAAQMLGICYRYTKSMSDAEDVLQEGFVKVFHYLARTILEPAIPFVPVQCISNQW